MSEFGWFMYDVSRIAAGVALLVMMLFTDADPASPAVIALVVYVGAGLLVSPLRRGES